MGQLSSKLRNAEGGRLTYWCQGCEDTHTISTGKDGWGFDGNLEAPTFSPSVLVRSGHYMSDWKGPDCWCIYNAKHPDKPSPFKCERCHTFIKAGMVQFLGDCTHALAGQTLPLPDLPPHLQDSV